MPRSSTRRLAAVALLALLAGTLSVGVTATAASAHDQVVSTVPASQEHLETSPTEVSMVFSDAILDLGATILVVDENDTDWAQGDVRIDGSTASQGLDGTLTDGRYQVRWRVVSADGHPISGTFDFAVGEVAEVDESEPEAAAASAVPALPAATGSDASRNAVVDPALLFIGLGGAVAGVLVFIFILTVRKRRTP
jgi:methionine-rich copper-binding protein CopC